MQRQLIDDFCTARGYIEKEYPQISEADFLERLRGLFLQHFPVYWVEERLSLPQDYLQFLELLRGDLRRSDWAFVGDRSSVLSLTKNFLEDFIDDLYERREEGKPQNADTLWLCAGYWSDKHQWIICVDKLHPRYGQLIDAYDDHPFLHDDFLTDDEFPSFSDFLAPRPKESWEQEEEEEEA